MNCANIRSRILSKTRPEKLPASLKEHVQTCSACQGWHRQLLAVQAVVAAAVVPSSAQRKVDFIKQFQAGASAPPVATAVETPQPPKVSKSKSAPKTSKPSVAVPKSTKAVTPAAVRQPLSERLTRFWPAGVAAMLVLGGAIIWSMKDHSGPTPVAASPSDPLLAKAVHTKVKLDTATTSTERLKVLLEYSQNIHDEATVLAKVAPGPEMDSLAKMYAQLVKDAVVKQARAMDLTQDKKTLLDCIDQLGKAEQIANRLAAEAPIGSDKPLRDIALAAKEGKETIARLTLGKAAS